MPNKASLADLITDAEQLTAATATNQDLLPSVEKHRAPVVQTLAEIKAMKAAQKQLIADKQKMTQDLQAALRRLKEQTIFLRTAIRGDIGPRTEKLVEFGIAPLRKRTRRPKPVEPPEQVEVRPKE